MEPQPEITTALVCGAALSVTAEELELAGVEVKDRAAFTALSQVVNLHKITLSKMTFADAGWDGLLAGIKAGTRLTHLSLTACGLGPKHAADLADIFSCGGCNIDTLCLAKNGLTGATFYPSGDVRDGVDSNLDGITTLFAALKSSQVIHIDFSGCGLGPGSMDRLAEYLRDATASIASLSLKGNLPCGRISKDNDGRAPWLPGKELEGWTSLCAALATSKTITHLDVSDCLLDSEPVALLADAIKLMTSIVTINISQSKIGVEGGQAIVEALKTTTLESIVIGNDLTLQLKGELESDSFDASGQSIDPGYAMIMAWWLTTPVTTSLVEVNMAEAIIGESGPVLVEAVKKSPSLEFITIGKGLRLSLKETYTSDVLDASNQNIESGGVALIAWWLTTSVSASVVSLTLDDNGIFGKIWSNMEYNGGSDQDSLVEQCDPILQAIKVSQLTYISLRHTGIGPLTMQKMATSLPASVVTINCLANNFGEDGLSTLLAAIKGTSVRSLCGLTEGQTVADFSGQNLGPIDCRIMAAEFSFQGFITSLTSLCCGSNPIKDEGMAVLLDAVKDVALIEFDIAKTEIGPPTAKKLAEVLSDATPFTASLTSLHCGSNPIGDVGMIPLLDAAKSVKLTVFDISSTEIGLDSADRLADALCDATPTPFSATLTRLDISGVRGVLSGRIARAMAVLAKAEALGGTSVADVCWGACEAADAAGIGDATSSNDEWPGVLALMCATAGTACAGAKGVAGDSILHLIVRHHERLVKLLKRGSAHSCDEFASWAADQEATPPLAEWLRSAHVDAGLTAAQAENILELDVWFGSVDELAKIEEKEEQKWNTIKQHSELTDGQNAKLRLCLRSAADGTALGAARVVSLLDKIAAACAGSTTSPDSKGLLPGQVAKASSHLLVRRWGACCGAFLGRYELQGVAVHSSATCLVIFATNVADPSQPEVALKFMTNEDEWQREQAMRKNGEAELSGEHVLQLRHTQALSEDEVRACRENPKLRGDKDYRFLLEMPKAERDLSDLLSHDRIAGWNKAAVVDILRQVAKHLQYLHRECGRIHGDLKPRNIVKVPNPDSETGGRWILIDMDASCALGDLAGQKVTSSAYFPPEMARRELKKEGEVPATVPFEMWYYGLLVFQLCTVDGETVWKSSQADNLVHTEEDMPALAYHFDERKLQVAQRILESARGHSQERQGDWTDAVDLCLWCLQPQAQRRPESIDKMLEHPLFSAGEQGATRYHFDASASERAEQLHHAVDDGCVDSVAELFEQGGVHYNLLVSDTSSIRPLHRAARIDHVGMVQTLMKEVDDNALPGFVDARSEWLFTALHWCAAFNSHAVARLLIQSRCDTGLLNYRGKTAWDVAEASQSQEVLTVFEELESSGEYPLLVEEQQRRKHRPQVAESFRDDISIDHGRLTLWGTPQRRYCQWSFLAKGGFGKVYKIKDVSPALEVTGRRFSVVAVKIPLPDGVDELKAEVEALSRLTHDNVVAILGMTEGPSLDSDEKSWMMCLEFCESDLFKLLYAEAHSGKCTMQLIKRVCGQIVDGMTYVHSQTVSVGGAERIPMRHLDLKPENILLAKSGTGEWVAKVADFGWRPDITPEEWTGTTQYMAPEFAALQQLGEAEGTDSEKMRGRTDTSVEVGQAADVFSFGVILWQMVTRAEVDQWKYGWKLKLTNIPVSFPPKLSLLVQACWAVAPTNRPSFAEVQRLLADETLGLFAQLVSSWLTSLGVTAGVDCFDGYVQGDLEALTVDSADFTALLEDDDLEGYIEEIADELPEADREAFVAGMKAMAAAQGGEEEASGEPQEPRERLLGMVGCRDDEDVVALRGVIAQKDEEIAQKDEEIAQKDEEIAQNLEILKRKDEETAREIASLKAQLEALRQSTV
eukprot:COSAG05_NODE_8_length_40675_cov_148.837539_29_plen_1881_part_00